LCGLDEFDSIHVADDLVKVTCQTCRVLFDMWLEKGGPPLENEVFLRDYDWRSAFAYAKAQPVEGVEGAPIRYGIGNVRTVVADSAGENEGPSWLMVAKMHDGNFMYLEAGCDNTGWECHAEGSAWYAPMLDLLIQRALKDEARERLKLH
jgi:hypothetical protein